MSAELHVHPERPPVQWEDFVTSPTIHPLGSIALDGYVTGPPRFTERGPYYNANHHEDVDRLATGSTAEQVFTSLRMGLTRQFQKDGEFSPDVFVNDCDQDVCAAWYLLAHPEIADDPTFALNRFIAVAGKLDATAGAYPFNPDLEILGQLNWVFDPYNEFRISGEMARRDGPQYRQVIDDVSKRIDLHLAGQGNTLPLDLRYREVGGSDDWRMIEAIGKDGRVGALMDGIDAYVLVQTISDTNNTNWRYSIGRRSEFIPFPIPEILDRLNTVEGCSDERWGGATTIAGGPRGSGSRLSPAEVERIVNDVLGEQSYK